MEEPSADYLRLEIRRIVEENKNKFNHAGGDAEDRRLISQLFSQLEALEGNNGPLQQPEQSAEPKEISSAVVKVCKPAKLDGDAPETAMEEIVKELNEVKRQNAITHWLLSGMLVLTLAWQLSELSLIWKVKNGLSDPFRFLGGMFSGILRGPGSSMNNKNESKHEEHHVESHLHHHIEIPELPHMHLTPTGFSGEKD